MGPSEEIINEDCVKCSLGFGFPEYELSMWKLTKSTRLCQRSALLIHFYVYITLYWCFGTRVSVTMVCFPLTDCIFYQILVLVKNLQILEYLPNYFLLLNSSVKGGSHHCPFQLKRRVTNFFTLKQILILQLFIL